MHGVFYPVQDKRNNANKLACRLPPSAFKKRPIKDLFSFRAFKIVNMFCSRLIDIRETEDPLPVTNDTCGNVPGVREGKRGDGDHQDHDR